MYLFSFVIILLFIIANGLSTDPDPADEQAQSSIDFSLEIKFILYTHEHIIIL